MLICVHSYMIHRDVPQFFVELYGQLRQLPDLKQQTAYGNFLLLHLFALLAQFPETEFCLLVFAAEPSMGFPIFSLCQCVGGIAADTQADQVGGIRQLLFQFPDICIDEGGIGKEI